MDDNMYPNDSSYFFPSEPAEQALDRKKERAQTLEGKTVLADLLERWNEKIAFYSSTTSITDEVKLDPKKLAIIITAYDEITTVLQAEKEYIEDLVQAYQK